MYVQPVVGGPLETVGYLIYDRPSGSALIVDAPLASTARFTITAGEKAEETVIPLPAPSGAMGLASGNDAPGAVKAGPQ